MALKMDIKLYQRLGYTIMKRMDYTSDMVYKFRAAIKKYIVPLAEKLREKQ